MVEKYPLKMGFNEKISNSYYHNNREFISSSGIKLMGKDPRAFYKTYVLNEEKMQMNQSALDFGSYVHALILEPEIVQDEFAIFTGASRRGKAWKEFEEANNDKIIITASQDRMAQELFENFKKSTVIMGEGGNEKEVLLSSFYDKGKAEETLCVELEGVKVKVRFDYRKEWDSFGSINDIKTTTSFAHNVEQVEEICDAFGYHVSAALYVDAVEKETGKKHDFYFTFISKKDGQSYMYKASESMLERGREAYKKGLRALKEARETGVYYKNIIKELK